MSKNIEGAPSSHPIDEHDCGCGCNGAGDCVGAADGSEVTELTDRSRRRLMVGGTTIAVVATLANRRAFAGAACGPISRAGSLNPSHSTTSVLCGGLTPGYWKNHALATTHAIGGSSPSAVQLGSLLPALNLVDIASASMTFQAALCASSSAAFHWAAAILNASTPAWNPSYGYTISSLNSAILAAYNNGHGAGAATILTAIKTLENDYNIGTVPSPYNANQHLC